MSEAIPLTLSLGECHLISSLLSQYWLRKWHSTWWYRTITWTNVDQIDEIPWTTNNLHMTSKQTGHSVWHLICISIYYCKETNFIINTMNLRFFRIISSLDMLHFFNKNVITFIKKISIESVIYLISTILSRSQFVNSIVCGGICSILWLHDLFRVGVRVRLTDALAAGKAAGQKLGYKLLNPR